MKLRLKGEYSAKFNRRTGTIKVSMTELRRAAQEGDLNFVLEHYGKSWICSQEGFCGLDPCECLLQHGEGI